jgi:hypothetical protein
VTLLPEKFPELSIGSSKELEEEEDTANEASIKSHIEFHEESRTESQPETPKDESLKSIENLPMCHQHPILNNISKLIEKEKARRQAATNPSTKPRTKQPSMIAQNLDKIKNLRRNASTLKSRNEVKKKLNFGHSRQSTRCTKREETSGCVNVETLLSFARATEDSENSTKKLQEMSTGTSIFQLKELKTNFTKLYKAKGGKTCRNNNKKFRK